MEPGAVRTLLIDNYDSYTYNLHNILAEVNGGEWQKRWQALGGRVAVIASCFFLLAVEPLVVTNDALDLDGIRALIVEHHIDNIVISPGPGTPACGADIGT
jgi:para-aminobenzoate synthetase